VVGGRDGRDGVSLVHSGSSWQVVLDPVNWGGTRTLAVNSAESARTLDTDLNMYLLDHPGTA